MELTALAGMVEQESTSNTPGSGFELGRTVFFCLLQYMWATRKGVDLLLKNGRLLRWLGTSVIVLI